MCFFRSKVEAHFGTDEVRPLSRTTIVILLGDTGSGKKTFIQCCENKTAPTRRNNLHTITGALASRHIEHPTRQTESVVLVKTRGYGAVESREVAFDVRAWFDENPSYEGCPIAIVYLIPITKTRSPGQEHWRNISHLAGFLPSLKCVVLATSMWMSPPTPHQEEREKLWRVPDWPDDATKPELMRFVKTTESAWNILDSILDHAPGDVRRTFRSIKF